MNDSHLRSAFKKLVTLTERIAYYVRKCETRAEKERQAFINAKSKDRSKESELFDMGRTEILYDPNLVKDIRKTIAFIRRSIKM